VTLPCSSFTPARLDDHLREQIAGLYSAHLPALRAILRKTFAGNAKALTDDDVDDAIQDAFSRLLRLVRAEGAVLEVPAAYVFAAARNSCVSMVRGRKLRTRDQTVERLHRLTAEQALREDFDGPADGCCGWIAEYLAEAPPEVTAVYELRFVEGLAQHGCADRLGVSRRRVRRLEALLVNGLRAYWASARGELPEQQARIPFGALPPAARNR
jgi:RNA polymerase sigma factor (sigma-70 family)